MIHIWQTTMIIFPVTNNVFSFRSITSHSLKSRNNSSLYFTSYKTRIETSFRLLFSKYSLICLHSMPNDILFCLKIYYYYRFETTLYENWFYIFSSIIWIYRQRKGWKINLLVDSFIRNDVLIWLWIRLNSYRIERHLNTIFVYFSETRFSFI